MKCSNDDAGLLAFVLFVLILSAGAAQIGRWLGTPEPIPVEVLEFLANERAKDRAAVHMMPVGLLEETRARILWKLPYSDSAMFVTTDPVAASVREITATEAKATSRRWGMPDPTAIDLPWTEDAPRFYLTHGERSASKLGQVRN